ncbi:hemin receptor [Corynebacterium phocae]|uniref:Hemin receptor n=1 Tax=Corynebacterium phocae TaxID=161895 RepID=A0A1L7D1S0_9CORY|nr:globin [Corynebacterium phocae]APT92048.1 hemin receptor [Corynebacterium phocae]KAA8726432.1 globin [Corynebacterium phocae]
MNDNSVYAAIGGEPTFDRLVSGFYAQVPGDDILGPMYPADDMEGAANRLKWFLMQYWGGPTEYQERRGHPRLRMRHHPFPIDRAAAIRWVELMENSLALIEEETIPPVYRHMLRDHFERVAAMLINMPD